MANRSVDGVSAATEAAPPPPMQSSAEDRGRRLRTAAGYVVPPAVALFLVAVVWEIWVNVSDVPEYIVPAPSAVLGALLDNWSFYVKEGAVTLSEALAGFVLGSAVALTFAALMAHSRFLERSLLPLAIMVKVTPLVAVAPLFVIWFGFGSFPKVLIAALITFFPVLVNTLTGLRSVNSGALDFFRSVNASTAEIYFKLRVPGSLPYVFAAFRVAIPLSIIGAVVGEFFGGGQGLGSVIFVAHHNLDMPTSFAAILVLAAMGISLTVVPSHIERRMLFWHDSFIMS